MKGMPGHRNLDRILFLGFNGIKKERDIMKEKERRKRMKRERKSGQSKIAIKRIEARNVVKEGKNIKNIAGSNNSEDSLTILINVNRFLLI
jgi:hypothetical protein